MDISQAQRIGGLKYAIRNIANSAAKLEEIGRRILYLNIGDPLLFDFETPPALVEAVTKAMRDGRNYYSPSYGIPTAREAIAVSLDRQGVDVAPGDVFITAGASEAIEATFTAMLNPGDNVLTPCPGYPLYSAILCKLSAEERSYQLAPEANWRPDLEHLEAQIDDRTRGVVVINPNNPTGAVWDATTLLGIVDIARRHGLVIFADEVYHTLTYDAPAPRIASLSGEVPVVAFDSLSKSHLATGWRAGWLALHGDGLHKEVKGAICRLLDARLCSPTPPQFAIPEAVNGDQSHLATAMGKLRERREALMQGLSNIPGFWCGEPQGAFYAMARFEYLGDRTDEEFVLDVLNTENVLTVHGSGFGMNPRDGYFRIVYLPPVEVLDAAIAGLGRVAEQWSCKLV